MAIYIFERLRPDDCIKGRTALNVKSARNQRLICSNVDIKRKEDRFIADTSQNLYCRYDQQKQGGFHSNESVFLFQHVDRLLEMASKFKSPNRAYQFNYDTPNTAHHVNEETSAFDTWKASINCDYRCLSVAAANRSNQQVKVTKHFDSVKSTTSYSNCFASARSATKLRRRRTVSKGFRSTPLFANCPK